MVSGVEPLTDNTSTPLSVRFNLSFGTYITLKHPHKKAPPVSTPARLF